MLDAECAIKSKTRPLSSRQSYSPGEALIKELLKSVITSPENCSRSVARLSQSRKGRPDEPQSGSHPGGDIAGMKDTWGEASEGRSQRNNFHRWQALEMPFCMDIKEGDKRKFLKGWSKQTVITSSSPINGFIYTYIERVKVFLVSKLQKLL